jgi:tetratricopeptide (TPR) repeat protein
MGMRSPFLAALLALGLIPPAPAQPPDASPPPDPDRARRLTREAAVHYGLAVFQQRQDRLVEAARNLEEAVRLDPEAVPPRRLLVSLYNALGRPDAAARTAAAVLILDPSQADTWRTLARLLHEMKRTPEAVAVLSRCLATPQLADRPADLIAAGRDLGGLLTALGTHDKAADAYRVALDRLTQNRAALQAQAADPLRWERERAELSEELGSACLAARQFAEARTAVEQARTAYRQLNDAARAERLTPQLAAAHAGLGDAARANALLDPYLAGRPRDREAYALKARLLREAGQGGSVPALLAGYARAMPEFIELQVLLGDECRRLGERANAETAYSRAVARRPDVAAYRGLFAVLAGPGGSPVRMLTLINDTLRRSQEPPPAGPGDAEPAAARRDRAAERSHARAMATALRQEPAAAGLLLRTAIAELPRGRGPRRELEHETWWLLAGIAEWAGQLGDAKDLLKESLATTRPGQQASVYAALIRVLWASRDRREIIRVCESGLRQANATSLVLLHANLARALMHHGRIAEALEHADQAAKLAADANRLGMRLLRVDVLSYAEKFPEAEAEARKLLQEFTQPDEVRRVRHALAHVASAARQFDRAEEQLRMILELDPNDASAHNDLGYQLADQGRKLDEAERLIRRALELDRLRKTDSLKNEDVEEEDENAAYLDSLAWVLFRRGRLAEAQALLERAVVLPEGAADPIVWDHLGDVYVRLGRTAEAEKAWSTARGLYDTEKRSLHDPRGAEVGRKLKRLKLSNP